MTAESPKPTRKAKSEPARLRGKGALANLRRDEVVRLALMMTPASAIAKRLGVTPQRVSEILAEPEVVLRLEAARRTAFEDARAELRTLTRRAVAVLGEEMEGRSSAQRVRAAIEVLSKAGADAPRRFDVALLAGMTNEEIESEFKKLREENGIGG